MLPARVEGRVALHDHLVERQSGRLVEAHNEPAGQVFNGEQVGHDGAVLDLYLYLRFDTAPRTFPP
jgi:hypothetical protein